MKPEILNSWCHTAGIICPCGGNEVLTASPSADAGADLVLCGTGKLVCAEGSESVACLISPTCLCSEFCSFTSVNTISLNF